MWINLSKWSQNVKIPVSHVKSAEVDNRICFVDISHHSSATPVIDQWLMNKMARVAGIKGTRGHSNIGVYSPRLTWPLPLLSAQSASSRGQYRVCNVTPFPRWSASYLTAGWLHWSTSMMEGAAFCSCWNRFLLWIWICFLCLQCFCKTHHLWTYRISYSLS